VDEVCSENTVGATVQRVCSVASGVRSAKEESVCCFSSKNTATEPYWKRNILRSVIGRKLQLEEVCRVKIFVNVYADGKVRYLHYKAKEEKDVRVMSNYKASECK